MRSRRITYVVPVISIILLVTGTLLLYLGSRGTHDDLVAEVGTTIEKIIESCKANDVVASPNPSTALHLVADPARIFIPSIDVDASIVTTGISSDGVVDIPGNVNEVGWYNGSSKPGGSHGSAVIVGHRDGTFGVDGAFYNLAKLNPGDPVRIVDEEGLATNYAVAAREVVAKKNFAKVAPEYFSKEGSPRLTLITCGGAYIKDKGGYQANVVVTALPREWPLVTRDSGSKP
jgi:LPXTG-site transpeptidase (sortase) family protein